MAHSQIGKPPGRYAPAFRSGRDCGNYRARPMEVCARGNSNESIWADFVGEGESEILQARNCVTGERFSLLEGAKGIFDAGWAGYRQEAHGLESEVTICVSPEDGTLFFHLRIRNASERSAAIQLLHAFPVALCTPAAMRAHPAFENLFVCSARAGENALVFSRRPGAPGQTPFRLAAMYSGRLRAVETDSAALRGREGRKYQLRGTVGCTLNPCAAMEGEMFLEAGETKEAHFAFGLLLPGEIPAWLEKNAAADAPERARRLANTQVRAMLGFLGLNADKHHLLSRATAFFADVRLSRRAGKFGPAGSAERPALWAMGISGDLPILSVRVGSREEVCLARDAVRAHEYYRTMGLTVDLVLVNDYGNDYEQPVRDALRDLVDSSHLRELSGRPGGVFLLDGTQLTEAQRALWNDRAPCGFPEEQISGRKFAKPSCIWNSAARRICGRSLGGISACDPWNERSGTDTGDFAGRTMSWIWIGISFPRRPGPMCLQERESARS